jgi:hypothetical protein
MLVSKAVFLSGYQITPNMNLVDGGTSDGVTNALLYWLNEEQQRRHAEPSDASKQTALTK